MKSSSSPSLDETLAAVLAYSFADDGRSFSEPKLFCPSTSQDDWRTDVGEEVRVLPVSWDESPPFTIKLILRPGAGGASNPESLIHAEPGADARDRRAALSASGKCS